MASSYELKIENILRQKKLTYKKEVSIIGLKGINQLLRFDFQVFKTPTTFLFIEVDGEYHFKPIRGKLAFQRQKAYDGRKDAYCLAHNIELIRIPYWEIPNITFEKIFTTQYFVVKRKYHNSFLIPPN